MQYLCLVYQEESKMDAFLPSELDALASEALAYRDELRHRGHYVASSRLQPSRTAATVRVRNGQVSLGDGPFAETREQLNGFYLLDARDLNDAIRLASKMPPARIGSIEIRPLAEFDAA